MAQYYSLLTAIGAAQIANAISLGGTVTVTQFAVGTGNGAEYDPTEDQTALRSEVYRGNVNSIDIVTGTPNVIEFHCVIPVTEGGWTLREVGLFDAEGNLLVIAKYPSSYKPVQSEGTAGDFSLKIQVGVVNTDVVELKIDPAVILATKKNVDDAIDVHKNDPNAHPHNHDDRYAAKIHSHPLIEHDHDDRYASKGHSHALPSHTHKWSEITDSPEVALPPFYPDVQTAAGCLAITDNGDGTITIAPAQKWFMEGKYFNTDDYPVADRTFAIPATGFFHLRFTQANGFALKDLGGVTYNPSGIDEAAPVFDTTYTDMLIAKIDNGVCTPLVNKARLDLSAIIKETKVVGTNSWIWESQAGLNFNWSRTPTVLMAQMGMIVSGGYGALEPPIIETRHGQLVGFGSSLVAIRNRYGAYPVALIDTNNANSISTTCELSWQIMAGA